MKQQLTTGTIIFIHHEKKYATIEYTQDNRKKSINGSIDEKDQQRWKEKKLIKKIHSFNIGDEVSFSIEPSAKRDKMIASCIEFRFNNAHTNLINKAAVENRFVGYLKKADDQYFVKETGSYIVFPLVLSPWEIPPHEDRLNEPVFFKLDNIEKPNAITASLYRNEYIPEYKTALEHYKNKSILTGTVTKVTPFGIFVSLLNDKFHAKISLKAEAGEPASEKVGDIIKVRINYLGPLKIVIEKVV